MKVIYEKETIRQILDDVFGEILISKQVFRDRKLQCDIVGKIAFKLKADYNFGEVFEE